MLLTANRLVERRGGRGPFDVATYSVDGGAVTGYGGLGLTPTHGALADAGTLGVLIVPGLIDLDAIAAMDDVLTAVCEAAHDADIVAGVCTGSFLLDAAGVLGDAAAHHPLGGRRRPGGTTTGRGGHARRRAMGRCRTRGDVGGHDLGHRDDAAPRRTARRRRARPGHGGADRLRVDRASRQLTSPTAAAAVISPATIGACDRV